MSESKPALLIPTTDLVKSDQKHPLKSADILLTTKRWTLRPVALLNPSGYHRSIRLWWQSDGFWLLVVDYFMSQALRGLGAMESRNL